MTSSAHGKGANELDGFLAAITRGSHQIAPQLEGNVLIQELTTRRHYEWFVYRHV